MTEVPFDQVRQYLGLKGPGGLASTWPDFEDGRKGRIFVEDPRLPADEGDNDPALTRQVIYDFCVEMAEHFKPEEAPA